MGARVLPETTDCTGRQAASYTTADRCLCDTLACGTALQSRAGTAPQVPIPTAPFPTASRGGARGRCCETEPGSVQSTPVREAKSTEFGRLEGRWSVRGGRTMPRRNPPEAHARENSRRGSHRHAWQAAACALVSLAAAVSCERAEANIAGCQVRRACLELCARRDMTAAPSACVAPVP